MTEYTCDMTVSFDKQNDYYVIKDSQGGVKFYLGVMLRNNSAAVLYKTPTSLFLRALVSAVDSLLIVDRNRVSKTIAMTGNALIPANRWQHLTTLTAKDAVFSPDYQGYKKCQLKVQMFVIEYVTEEMLSTIPRLSTDLGNLLDKGFLSDVVLKSSDDVEHKAHKAVISRSPVLRAALQHGPQESNTDVINSPFESAVLEQVLKFIYTDQAPGIRAVGAELLAAADYYQLDLLKWLCEQVLSEQVTTENCLEILQIADQHSAPVLKNVVLQYINKTAEVLVDTESWKNLQKIELVKIMYEKFVRKSK